MPCLFTFLKLFFCPVAQLCGLVLKNLNIPYKSLPQVPQHVSDNDSVFNRTLMALKAQPNAR